MLYQARSSCRLCQDAKAFGETVCSQFLSVTRNVIGERTGPSFPRTREPMPKKNAAHMFAMGPGRRGHGAAGRFEADFRLPVGFNRRI
jgi:hypothetical protein